MKRCILCGITVMHGKYCPVCGGTVREDPGFPRRSGSNFAHSFPYTGGVRAFTDKVNYSVVDELDTIRDLLLGVDNVFKVDAILNGCVVLCVFEDDAELERYLKYRSWERISFVVKDILGPVSLKMELNFAESPKQIKLFFVY